MKTTIITLFAALTLATGTIASASASTTDKENVTVLTGISNINKIEVHGNVELYVSDGSADEVKVYNKYYSESALVQNKDGVLRISSYKAEKLVVWVTAYDLRTISAYDNSTVKSFGSISKIEFAVDLHDNAAAKLNIDAVTANVTANDQSKADLTGTVNDFDLKYSLASSVNQTGIVAKNVTKTMTTKVATDKAKDLGFLDL